MSKLLLVDGSALLHRAYHAYPPLKTKSGEIVGAVYGVASILISALESEQPSHVMVAWDLPKPTFRHIKYVGYKAQRPKADAEMVEQIPMVKEVIQAMGIVQVAEEGYEADDIIGTLSYEAGERFKNKDPKDDTEVVILTGDQDTMQLVNEHVKILTPAKGANPPVLYGVDEVLNKYGVKPSQIVDYKALVGDPSDNIPGVAGIGPKGAAQLLKTFGSLERIYRDIKEVQLHFGEQTAKKLADGKDSAFLSQDLSRIVIDMKLLLSMEEMEYHGFMNEETKAKFEELGFKSLIRRFFPGEEEPKKKKNDNQMGLF
jgi:DNA polymerase-1